MKLAFPSLRMSNLNRKGRTDWTTIDCVSALSERAGEYIDMLDKVLDSIPLDIVCLMETCVFPQDKSLGECTDISLLCSVECRRKQICYLSPLKRTC